MNFLHIIGGLQRSGAELFLKRFCEFGQKKGDSHVVLNLGPETVLADEIKDFADVVNLDVRKNLLKSILVLMGFLLRNRRFDYVYGWMYYGNAAAFIVGTIFRSRVICNIRHSLVDLSLESRRIRIAIIVNKWISMLVHKVVFNSKASQEQHVAFGFCGKNCVVISNGYFFTDQVHQDFSKKEGLLIFGHAGRFHPMKNQLGIIKVFLKLLEVDRNIQLIFVGRGMLELKMECIDLLPDKFSKNIIFMEELDDLSEFYLSLDLFVNFSSWGESFPNVLVEAMSFGIPCVATNLGDVPEIIGEFGYVIDPGKSDQLFSVLFNVLKELRGGALRVVDEKSMMTHIQDRFSMANAYECFRSLSLNSR